MNGSGFWKKKSYVIDVGSTNVTIYGDDRLLLKEPSVVTVSKGPGMELIAAGSACAAMRNRPDAVTINPIEAGAVVNPEAAGLMLESFFNQVIRRRVPAPDCYALVSAGLTATERDSMEAALRKGGARNVMLVESVFALLPHCRPKGSLVIVLGGGTTEIGVVSEAEGILSACSVNIAGNTIDQKIAEYVRGTYNATISVKTAEFLKKEIGSLYENDASALEVVGTDVLDGVRKKFSVSAAGIRGSIKFCLDKIFEVAESLVATLPHEAIRSVSESGLVFAGLGAEMRGLKEYAQSVLQLHATVLQNPEYACSEALYRMIRQSDRYANLLPRQ